MSIRHDLGYRFRGLLGLGRLYGHLKNWRMRDNIPPTVYGFVLTHSSTPKRITYVVSAVSNLGGTLTYDVDYGDGSGHGSASTGGRTYTTGGLKTMTARVTDSLGGSTVVEAKMTADVAQTDILLSEDSIDEDQASGSTVGLLSCTDADVGDVYVFTLVAGSGDTDNASFTIVGNALKTAISLNYENKASYDIRVLSTDQNGVTFAKALTITVNDVFDTAPLFVSAAIAASNAYVDLTYDHGLYTNAIHTLPVLYTDFALTFAQHSGTGGTATACAITGASTTGGEPLVGGESVIRLLLSVTGTVHGEETIAIAPASGTAIYGVDGVAVPVTEDMVATALNVVP